MKASQRKKSSTEFSKELCLHTAQTLQKWYQANQRALPWRLNRDPYRIWVSEVMLQQTTVAAVVPFYEKFMLRFPDVQKLANSTIEDVYEHWAGLGYYSRARCLHRSAQIIAQNGFPKSAAELLELPGFGPYTSRAVSSLAFSEKVGVLDGNVIRVLSRFFGLKIKWWNTTEKNHLQKISDQLAQHGDSEKINQALMDLGATICTPQKPVCLLCPIRESCIAHDKNLTELLPLKKPRRQTEVWVWKPLLIQRKKNSVTEVAMLNNDYAPFLKGKMIFPGTISMQKQKPKSFDLKHSITHHDIYIQIEKSSETNSKSQAQKKGQWKWISLKDLKKTNPSSLLQKVLYSAQK